MSTAPREVYTSALERDVLHGCPSVSPSHRHHHHSPTPFWIDQLLLPSAVSPYPIFVFFNSTNCFFRHWFNKRFVWNSPPESLIHLRPGGEILFLSCLGGGPFQRKYTWDFILSWQFQSGGAGGQQRQLSDHKNAKRRKLCQIYIGDKRRRSALIVNCSFPCVRGFKV